MDSGAGVDGGEIGRTGGFRDFECAVHLVGAFADADREDGTDAGGVGAGEDSGEFVRGVHVEMGVRVDEGHGLGSRFEVRGKAEAAGVWEVAQPLGIYTRFDDAKGVASTYIRRFSLFHPETWRISGLVRN
jgi:hypothetical protein